MQIEIKMSPLDNSPLSFDYLYGLHSFLMHSLTGQNQAFAEELHDGAHKNRLKLFSFSPLSSLPAPALTEADPTDGRRKIVFGEKVWWRIASPWPELLHTMAEGILAAGKMRLLNKTFKIEAAGVIAPPEFKEEMVWRPFGQSASICTEWTPQGTDENEFVYPDAAHNPSCSGLLAGNLVHKFRRFSEIRQDIIKVWMKDAEYSDSVSESDIGVEFIETAAGRPYRTMRGTFKTSSILSWRCPVQIKAPLPIQRLIWDCGLGSRNSQGYGLVQEGKQ